MDKLTAFGLSLIVIGALGVLAYPNPTLAGISLFVGWIGCGIAGSCYGAEAIVADINANPVERARWYRYYKERMATLAEKGENR